MLKCSVCFARQLPSAWVATQGQDNGFYKPEEVQQEEQHIALAQSEDAVTVYQGKALCLEHLVDAIHDR